MKLRCTNCGKVVKFGRKSYEGSSVCPECHSEINTILSTSQNEDLPITDTGQTISSKGRITASDKTVEAIGWIVTLLVLAVLGCLARILWKVSNAMGLIATGVCILVTLAVGVWFNNKARR
jgi:phage FluMu protein Com